MGAQQVEALTERLVREGYVEFRVRPVKAALQVLLLVWFLPIIVLIGVGFGPVGGIVGGAFAVFLLVGTGARLGQQLLGAGPALRVDRTGLTLRRWKAPMYAAWSSDLWIAEYHPSGLAALRQVRVHFPYDVWDQHDAAHPVPLTWFSRFERLRGIPLLKVLDSSARDILAFLDLDVLTGLGIDAVGQRSMREAVQSASTLTDPELLAISNDVLEVSARMAAAENAAAAEGRTLDPAARAAFDAEFLAIADRHDAASHDDGAPGAPSSR